MTNEEYGVIKWMTSRFNNADTIYLIYRYGTVNNVPEEPNTDYKEVVCRYIQQTGFSLFTAWISAYLDDKNKKREKQNSRRKRLTFLFLLLIPMLSFAQHDKILVELFTIQEYHQELEDYFTADPRVEFVHWHMNSYEDPELVYQRKRRLDTGFDKPTGFCVSFNGKPLEGDYKAILDSLFYFYPTNKLKVDRALNRLKIASKEDSHVWMIELSQNSYRPAHAQVFFLKSFDVLNTSVRTDTKRVLVFSEDTQVTKLITINYPHNGIH